MKLSAISATLLAFPLVAHALSVPAHGEDLVARQRGKNRGGGGGNTGNASTAAAAAAASSTAAATSAAAGSTKTSTATADNSDPQNSLTLDPRVISQGFLNDGQDVPTAGQVASLTSGNNFINFCLTVPNLPLTDGKQIKTGSCNTAPIGVIPSTDNMPSAKFVSPKNTDTIAANTAFNVVLSVKNIQLGHFTNAQENYFMAPQTVNAQGQIIGHTHIVMEQLDSMTQTTVTNPNVFAFFKGVNDPQDGNGQVTVPVTAGLPPAVYRLCTINSSSNHQPVIAPVAQHGSLDDCVYFTATAGGGGGNNNNNNNNAAGNATAAAGTNTANGNGNNNNAAAASTAAAAATSSAAATAGGTGKGGRGGRNGGGAAGAAASTAAAAATSSAAATTGGTGRGGRNGAGAAGAGAGAGRNGGRNGARSFIST